MSIVPANADADQTPVFVPAEVVPDYHSFITEDETPVDNWYCERQHRLLIDVLHASWEGPRTEQPRCYASDIGLFYAMNEPPVVPDVMISLNVAPPTDWIQKKHRSYYTWLMGKPPELAVDVVSNVEGGELTHKMEHYARIGIIYYVVWDPANWLSKTPLQCFALNRKKYVPCDPWFPELELGVATWNAEYDGLPGPWLRWCDQQGQILPTGLERADKLAAKLRTMGIDPDQV